MWGPGPTPRWGLGAPPIEITPRNDEKFRLSLLGRDFLCIISLFIKKCLFTYFHCRLNKNLN